VISLEFKAPAYGKVRRELQILKFRGSDFASGFHDFVIRADGIEVFPRLVASDHQTAFGRSFIASGVASLDALLGGGIERGTSTPCSPGQRGSAFDSSKAPVRVSC
jgi:circadian clock protein KaiC